MTNRPQINQKPLPPKAKTFFTTLSQIGDERGKINELKVEMAFSVPESRPDWFKKIRKATPDEDTKGIDFIIESDVGSLFLQVKSSWAGVRQHLSANSSANIAVVIVKSGDDQQTVVKKCLEVLEYQRKKYLKFRNTEE